jgi:hypothetical protein
MANYRLRISGALPQSLSWSTGFNMVSSAGLSTVASTLDSAWNTLWTDATGGLTKWVHSDITTIETEAILVNSTWRTVTKLPTPRALAGTNANITGNLASSPYVAFTGANDTKSDRGRMKFPPFAADQISAGLILNATVDAFAVVITAFMTTMSGLAGAEIVSTNRITNKQGDAPFTTHQLTGGTFSNRPGTERARERKLKATHSAAVTF